MLLPGSLLQKKTKVNLIVGIGDMLASDQANACLSTYSLGSCVAVVIYDPIRRVGGLLHAMLPAAEMNPERARQRPYMFVDLGLPALFHSVYALGGHKERLTVKVAGGASIFGNDELGSGHGSVFSIGQRNITAVRNMLTKNRVKVTASDIGGSDVRTLRLDLENGELTMSVAGKGSRIL